MKIPIDIEFLNDIKKCLTCHQEFEKAAKLIDIIKRAQTIDIEVELNKCPQCTRDLERDEVGELHCLNCGLSFEEEKPLSEDKDGKIMELARVSVEEEFFVACENCFVACENCFRLADDCVCKVFIPML